MENGKKVYESPTKILALLGLIFSVIGCVFMVTTVSQVFSADTLQDKLNAYDSSYFVALSTLIAGQILTGIDLIKQNRKGHGITILILGFVSYGIWPIVVNSLSLGKIKKFAAEKENAPVVEAEAQ